MATTFHLRILSHEETLFDDQIESLMVPAATGYLGVLAHHAPLITSLSTGTVTIRDGEGNSQTFRLQSGILEVANNEATVLTESITRA